MKIGKALNPAFSHYFQVPGYFLPVIQEVRKPVQYLLCRSLKVILLDRIQTPIRESLERMLLARAP